MTFAETFRDAPVGCDEALRFVETVAFFVGDAARRSFATSGADEHGETREFRFRTTEPEVSVFDPHRCPHDLSALGRFAHAYRSSATTTEIHCQQPQGPNKVATIEVSTVVKMASDNDFEAPFDYATVVIDVRGRQSHPYQDYAMPLIRNLVGEFSSLVSVVDRWRYISLPDGPPSQVRIDTDDVTIARALTPIVHFDPRTMHLLQAAQDRSEDGSQLVDWTWSGWPRDFSAVQARRRAQDDPHWQFSSN